MAGKTVIAIAHRLSTIAQSITLMFRKSRTGWSIAVRLTFLSK